MSSGKGMPVREGDFEKVEFKTKEIKKKKAFIRVVNTNNNGQNKNAPSSPKKVFSTENNFSLIERLNKKRNEWLLLKQKVRGKFKPINH